MDQKERGGGKRINGHQHTLFCIKDSFVVYHLLVLYLWTLNCNEIKSRLCRKSLGHECFTAPWWSIQQNALGGSDTHADKRFWVLS